MVVGSSLPAQSPEMRAAQPGARHSRAVEPVCDPGMPSSFRRWAVSQRPVFSPQGDIAVLLPGGRSGGSRPVAAWCWLLAAACMILVFIDPPSIGRAGWLAAAAAMAMAAGTFQRRASRLDRRLARDKVIFPDDLDETSQALLGRGQRAIGTILNSDVRAAGLLKHPIHDGLLRQHEWELAGKFREITSLRSLLAKNTLGGGAGPMTADVLRAHRRAIELAQESTAARVVALERYAEQVNAADEADRDWQQAVKLSEFNDKYLDLVARTASDEHAIGEIAGLTEQLSAAARARRDKLHEADLAARILALPRSPVPPSTTPRQDRG